MEKLIVSPLAEFASASRNDPGPLSANDVTLLVAALGDGIKVALPSNKRSNRVKPEFAEGAIGPNEN